MINGIGLGALLWSGEALCTELLAVHGNMTAASYRNEILRPVAMTLVQQRQLGGHKRY